MPDWRACSAGDSPALAAAWMTSSMSRAGTHTWGGGKTLRFVDLCAGVCGAAYENL